ncbi:MAG: L,D-transpeptidase family protein [Kiritimatiellae bacterium]|nr:L,D-transpeptidase family protein [Kiritimatiellia bacterium]
MPDPGMMLKNLDEFREPSRRPWIAVIVIVVLATIAAILLLLQVERVRKTGAKPSEAAPPAPAATAEVSRAVSPPPEAASPEVARALATAQADERSDNLLAARTNYLALLARQDAATVRAFVEERLGTVNLQLLTTPHAMPEKVDYAIHAGDNLKTLARRFGTTAALIEKSNRIHDPNRIQIGDRIRILNKPAFAIAVSKSANDLVLTMNGQFLKRYSVGTGQYGRTPVGTFVIQDKIENPPWYHPDGKVIPFGDPANILGTRWMTLAATGDTPPAKGYGIHGTWDDGSLGKQSSAGCVRMRNADVEELYMLAPEGTPVRIAE